MLPRAASIGFNFAQPFFITAVIHYLETPPALREKSHAYGLIGAAALIYVGSSVRSALKGYVSGN
jgi:ATP-binding cassette subfamily C (CFTR/MRP) protein 1